MIEHSKEITTLYIFTPIQYTLKIQTIEDLQINDINIH